MAMISLTNCHKIGFGYCVEGQFIRHAQALLRASPLCPARCKIVHAKRTRAMRVRAPFKVGANATILAGFSISI